MCCMPRYEVNEINGQFKICTEPRKPITHFKDCFRPYQALISAALIPNPICEHKQSLD